MTDLSVHFSSVKSDWETPDTLFADLHREFDFTLDVCATKENAKLPNYITPEQDTFKTDWAKPEYADAEGKIRAWQNPPYGDPEHPCKKNCTKKKCRQHDGTCDHGKQAVQTPRPLH